MDVAAWFGKYDWVFRKSSFSTYQYITLVPRKSLMHHDIQKNISYHNFYLFFLICKWKEFELFQILENFKKKIMLMHHPVGKDYPCLSMYIYTI